MKVLQIKVTFFKSTVTSLHYRVHMCIEMRIIHISTDTCCTAFIAESHLISNITLKCNILGMETNAYVLGFDDHMFDSEVFQRPFQYLKCLELDKKTIPVFNRFHRSGDKQSCLQILMRLVKTIV